MYRDALASRLTEIRTDHFEYLEQKDSWCVLWHRCPVTMFVAKYDAILLRVIVVFQLLLPMYLLPHECAATNALYAVACFQQAT